MKCSIRQAKVRDTEQLVALAEQLIPLKEGVARDALLRTALHDPACTIFVAEVDDRLVGFIEVRVVPDFVEGAPIALIHNFVVKTDYRRQGVGSQLIQRVRDEVEQRNVTETHVWTEFDNHSALIFYTRHGFRLRGLLLERERDHPTS